MKNKLFLCIVFCPILLLLSFTMAVFPCHKDILSQNLIFESQVFENTAPSKITIATNTAKIYVLADLSSTVMATATYNDEFDVVDLTEDFYKIEYTENQLGYVLKAFCIDSELKPLEVYLDANATITSECFIYELIGGELVKIENLYLPAETRVKLVNGFSETNVYTQATVSLGGELFTYYIPTVDIDPDGISTRTIIAFMLILTCVTIFLILYSFFKGKKVTK